MVDLNGHEAGNGGYSQRKPTAHRVSSTRNIFHTYSAHVRGTEMTMNTYNYLDYVPKGRGEDGLPFAMAWIRHHDRYADGYLADADKQYWPADAVPAR